MVRAVTEVTDLIKSWVVIFPVVARGSLAITSFSTVIAGVRFFKFGLTRRHFVLLLLLLPIMTLSTLNTLGFMAMSGASFTCLFGFDKLEDFLKCHVLIHVTK